MDDQVFEAAIQIAIEQGLLKAEKRLLISEKLSGYQGLDYVLKDHSEKIICRINQGLVQGRLIEEGKAIPLDKYSSRRCAVQWAESMGYPVPTSLSYGCSFFLVIVGLLLFIIPGLLLLGWIWYQGKQYERDMDSLVTRWIDAGRPAPGEKEKPVGKLEEIKEEPALPQSTETRLEELASMRDKGLISAEEYETLRKKALGL